MKSWNRFGELTDGGDQWGHDLFQPFTVLEQMPEGWRQRGVYWCKGDAAVIANGLYRRNKREVRVATTKSFLDWHIRNPDVEHLQDPNELRDLKRERRERIVWVRALVWRENTSVLTSPHALWLSNDMVTWRGGVQGMVADLRSEGIDEGMWGRLSGQPDLRIILSFQPAEQDYRDKVELRDRMERLGHAISLSRCGYEQEFWHLEGVCLSDRDAFQDIKSPMELPTITITSCKTGMDAARPAGLEGWEYGADPKWLSNVMGWYATMSYRPVSRWFQHACVRYWEGGVQARVLEGGLMGFWLVSKNFMLPEWGEGELEDLFAQRCRALLQADRADNLTGDLDQNLKLFYQMGSMMAKGELSPKIPRAEVQAIDKLAWTVARTILRWYWVDEVWNQAGQSHEALKQAWKDGKLLYNLPGPSC